MVELFAEGKIDHVRGLLALQQTVIEEVAAGGDWPLSWSVLPIADPTDPSPVASMSVSQYATGVACLKDLSLIQDRRTKHQNTTNPNGGGDKRQPGKWTKLSAAQKEALEEWKKKNPNK